MPSLIRYLSTYPSTAEPGNGFVFDGDRYAQVEPFAATAQIHPRSGIDVSRLDPDTYIEEAPVVAVALDGEGQRHTDQGVRDRWIRTHERVFRYWLTCPTSLLSGVRAFVQAAEAGTLPIDWEERPADGAPSAYTACTFTATMDQARALGSEQAALDGLADIPGDVSFFQLVARINGFTGVRKESRQPAPLPQALYEPGTLFQTDVAALGDKRGDPFGEEDALNAAGLTIA